MRSYWLLIAAGLALVAGLAAILLGLVADPFALPFQDYGAMSIEQQASYERQAALMGFIRQCGLALLGTAVALGAAAALFGPRR